MRRGDLVKVLTGSHAGQTGRVDAGGFVDCGRNGGGMKQEPDFDYAWLESLSFDETAEALVSLLREARREQELAHGHLREAEKLLSRAEIVKKHLVEEE
jgi:hypothetical protein